MPKFRALKNELKTRLEDPDWQNFLPKLAAMDGRETLGPLLGFLLHGGEMTGRAACAIGVSVAALAGRDMEAARVVMRRLMWSMNEESGNIGWGIPQAMAEILARSPALAKEFNRVLISYIRDTGAEDNYIDHVPLLRYCFWAVGRLAASAPLSALPAVSALKDGLAHEDLAVRSQAALALLRLAEAVAGLENNDRNKARELLSAVWPSLGPGIKSGLAALESEKGELEYFDGSSMRSEALEQLASRAAQAVNGLEDDCSRKPS